MDINNKNLDKYLQKYSLSKNHSLVETIQDGLPLTDSPYAKLAEKAGMSEAELIRNITTLVNEKIIKRFGVVVRHHELGYRANAMVVWDIPDDRVSEIAHQMITEPFITLCYRRPRQLPLWRYNLYCMVHGKDRDRVTGQIRSMIGKNNWNDIPHEILFSKKRFKQRGASYRQNLHENKLNEDGSVL